MTLQQLEEFDETEFLECAVTPRSRQGMNENTADKVGIELAQDAVNAPVAAMSETQLRFPSAEDECNLPAQAVQSFNLSMGPRRRKIGQIEVPPLQVKIIR